MLHMRTFRFPFGTLQLTLFGTLPGDVITKGHQDSGNTKELGKSQYAVLLEICTTGGHHGEMALIISG